MDNKRHRQLQAKFNQLIKQKQEIGNKFLLDSDKISKEIKIVRDEIFKFEPNPKTYIKKAKLNWTKGNKITEIQSKMIREKLKQLHEILGDFKKLST